MWRIALVAVAAGAFGILWIAWNRKIDRWIKDADAEYATLVDSADVAARKTREIADIDLRSLRRL